MISPNLCNKKATTLLVILSLFEFAHGQMDLCHLDDSAKAFERIDLTKLRKFQGSWYAPVAYLDTNNATRWCLEKLIGEQWIPLTDTCYYYILDYSINNDKHFSVVGKKDRDTAKDRQSIAMTTVNNDQISSKYINPHYYVYDETGYMGLTDSASGHKYYTNVFNDSVSLYNPDNSPVNQQWIRKLFPLSKNLLVRIQDTLGLFYLFQVDTALRRITALTDFQSLSVAVENANETFYLGGERQYYFIYRDRSNNNIVRSASTFDTLINFRDNKDFAFGKKPDNSWWAINSKLNEFSIPVFPDKPLQSIKFFPNSTSSFVVTYESERGDENNPSRYINQIFAVNTHGIPEVAGVTGSMSKSEPVCRIGIRYYFIEENKEKLSYTYYQSRENTLVRLLPTRLPSDTIKLNIVKMPGGSTQYDFLVFTASHIYWTRFSPSAYQVVETVRFIDSVRHSFMDVNDRFLAVNIRASGSRSALSKDYIWKAVDLKNPFKDNKTTFITDEFNSLYPFVKMNTTCCKDGYYYSAIPSRDGKEKILKYNCPN